MVWGATLECLFMSLPAGEGLGTQSSKVACPRSYYMSCAFVLNHRLPNILSLPPLATPNRIN